MSRASDGEDGRGRSRAPDGARNGDCDPEADPLYVPLDARITVEGEGLHAPARDEIDVVSAAAALLVIAPSADEASHAGGARQQAGQNWILLNLCRYHAHLACVSRLLRSGTLGTNKTVWLAQWITERANVEAALFLWAAREGTRWRE